MAVEIRKLSCDAIPNVLILETTGMYAQYLFHAEQSFRYLLQKKHRQVSSSVMLSFFKTDAGKQMKNGGDLRTACLIGPLKSAIYTHHSTSDGRGRRSYFLTVGGLKELMDVLPDQDPIAKQKVIDCLEQCDGGSVSSSHVSETGGGVGICDDEDGIFDEIFTSGCGGAASNANAVNQNELTDVRLSMYQAFADNAVLKSRIQIKEAEMKTREAEIQTKDEQIKAREAEIKHTAVVCDLKLQYKDEVHMLKAQLKEKEIEVLRLQLAGYERRGQDTHRGRLERDGSSAKKPMRYASVLSGTGGQPMDEELAVGVQSPVAPHGPVSLKRVEDAKLLKDFVQKFLVSADLMNVVGSDEIKLKFEEHIGKQFDSGFYQLIGGVLSEVIPSAERMRNSKMRGYRGVKFVLNGVAGPQ